MAIEIHSNDEEILRATSLSSWIMAYVNDWENHYDQNYRLKFERYYRVFKGQWDAQDRTRDSERSHIISPASQQAVESSVAEVEEATFGRNHFFDLEDDPQDQDSSDLAANRKTLEYEFKQNKVRRAVAEVLLNSAICGTGLAEVVVEENESKKPATRPVLDGALQAVGVEAIDKVNVKLIPVLPQHFRIDPLACNVHESIGVAIDKPVPPHSVKQLQRDGVYKDVPIFADQSTDLEREADPQLTMQPTDKIRLTKWFGEVPKYLLELENLDITDENYIDEWERIQEEADDTMVEAIVVIANQNVVLKAEENPYLMSDRPVLAFQWDIDPGLFWGRGVCEKGNWSQKAIDTELRARIDALAYTIHPMMAVDSTKFVRGSDKSVRPGKTIFTNGDPRNALMPVTFGNVDQITFAQTNELQQMLQTATGAVDTTGVPGRFGSNDGGRTAAGISMSLGAIIKRHKRTLISFQEQFLIPFVEKAAWRYMQFAPEEFPAQDYQFIASSSLGIIAREYEVTQLVQLLQTMKAESPAYPILIEAIVDNMNVSNREDIIEALRKAAEPDPEAQKFAKVMQDLEIAFKEAQTKVLDTQGEEFSARAEKLREEAKMVVPEARTNRFKAIASAESDDDKEFSRRVQIAQQLINERNVATRERV